VSLAAQRVQDGKPGGAPGIEAARGDEPERPFGRAPAILTIDVEHLLHRRRLRERRRAGYPSKPCRQSLAYSMNALLAE
jgi:hypothetical protein